MLFDFAKPKISPLKPVIKNDCRVVSTQVFLLVPSILGRKL
jgi:hypothetical protein